MYKPFFDELEGDKLRPAQAAESERISVPCSELEALLSFENISHFESQVGPIDVTMAAPSGFESLRRT